MPPCLAPGWRRTGHRCEGRGSLSSAQKATRLTHIMAAKMKKKRTSVEKLGGKYCVNNEASFAVANANALCQSHQAGNETAQAVADEVGGDVVGRKLHHER